MSHVPHDLHEALPEYADAIPERKAADPHFARLMDDYHHLNREIHRAETNVAPTDDMHMIDLRKRRLALLDEMRRILAAA